MKVKNGNIKILTQLAKISGQITKDVILFTKRTFVLMS
jgi:hypothetical protein